MRGFGTWSGNSTLKRILLKLSRHCTRAWRAQYFLTVMWEISSWQQWIFARPSLCQLCCSTFSRKISYQKTLHNHHISISGRCLCKLDFTDNIIRTEGSNIKLPDLTNLWIAQVHTGWRSALTSKVIVNTSRHEKAEIYMKSAAQGKTLLQVLEWHFSRMAAVWWIFVSGSQWQQQQ